MSCNCITTDQTNPAFACTCDDFTFPQPLAITAGLTSLPRQIGAFPQFRQSMLYSIRAYQALAAWNARQQNDLGVMMLEMWAYVCDVLSFYDQVIANEQYIATASQRPSVRKLVALLGYLPSPAVGATATLAALASGVQPVTLPAGIAFRSAAFDGNPPQVFQLTQQTTIDPFTNQWLIEADHPGIITAATGSFFLIKQNVTIKTGTLLLLTNSTNSAQNQVLTVSASAPYTGWDGTAYAKISFSTPWSLSIGTPLSALNLLSGTASALIDSFADTNPTDTLVLDQLYRNIRAGDYLVINGQKTGSLTVTGPGHVYHYLRERGLESRWFTVDSVQDTTKTIVAGTSFTINGTDYTTPDTTVPVSSIGLDTDLNSPTRKSISTLGDWTDPAASQLILYFGFQSIGSITDEPNKTLAPNDPMQLTPPVQQPSENPLPSTFLLQDTRLNGTELTGQIDFTAAVFTPDQGQTFSPNLINPVDLYGNVLAVNRGETVAGEILGSGDATAINQTFTLKKNPLTYLPSPTADDIRGVAATLSVYVDGIRWTETTFFYNTKPTDRVYILRQNDNGETLVTFGDGINGARLPTGANNIVANYQTGAGAAAPTAGTITQIVNPFKGLRSVFNVLAAGGGADADPADKIRTLGPDSALLLGRAVSIDDVTVASANYPGVQTVQVEWRWQPAAQQPMIHIWYIGPGILPSQLVQKIHGLTDPTVPIFAEVATSRPSTMQLDVNIDPTYQEDTVLAALREALAATPQGFLLPAVLGIGQTLFRSALFEAALAVEGILYVNGIIWDGTPFLEYGRRAPAGCYYDFNAGTLILNGKAS